MASGPLAGGAAATAGDGSRDKHRWSESKVYTRKTHNKAPKPTPNNPQLPPPPAADVTSSHPPPLPSTSAAASDDASSLNNNHHSNGQDRSVKISVASQSRDEVRDLRRRLTAELEQVRALSKKLDLQFGAAAAATGGGYTQSQHSVSDPGTAAAPPPRRQISVSVPPDNNNNSTLSENFEKEKRTPKANQLYRNSDFLLIGKDKFPPPEFKSHKKLKPNGTQLAEKKFSQAFKSCANLLPKLMKHKHGWVFNTPVDVKGLGLHDYYTIIKRPMDLGTIKSRLNKNWYKSPMEFAEDVRLTFRNAMTYNPKGQDVHVMAEQLLNIFEEHWPAIEAGFTYIPSYQPPVPTVKKAPPLPIDVRTLERSDSTVQPVVAESKPKPVNHTPHIGRPPALKKPKAKDLYKRDMTLEEKQRLSNNLQNLPSEKLDSVVQIIKKRNSSLSQHDDEIEVDIDSVDVETLWELDRFVTNYKKSLSKNKRKAELAILAKAEAEKERMQQGVLEPGIGEGPKENRTVVDEKEVASSSPVGEENKREDASRSSSSSSSSSDSGSSSSDSDSDSSSAYGSDAGHSPRT